MLSRSKNFWYKKETYIILSDFSLLLPKKKKKEGGKLSNEWSVGMENMTFPLKYFCAP